MSGFVINLQYTTAALAAPAAFRAGIQRAADLIQASIRDNISVNISVEYAGTGGGAGAGPSAALFQTYTSVRANLIANASAGDTIFSSLPNTASIQGQTNVLVMNAQLKAMGLLSGANAATDGDSYFNTDIAANALVGVALHELTHAMGRVPNGPEPDIFDLFRFTGVGTRLFTGGATAVPAYFSVDGGTTKLADYGQTSDSADFLNTGVQGPNDPFNEFYNVATSQNLSAVDLLQMDALGFHMTFTPGDDIVILALSGLAWSALGGNDNVTGTGGADTIDGGAGADTLDGGAGNNTASYASATAAVKAVLFEKVYNLGDAAGDVYINIQNLMGSNIGDDLFGDGGANILSGGGGNDILFGMDGNDTLIGGTAGAGTYNQLWGGDGVDTASYAAETTSVTAFIEGNFGYVGGVAAGNLRDTFNSIENLIGGAANDVLVGDANANVIEGGAGADQIYGRDGADIFMYRAFADSNVAGGYDTIADFATGTDKIDLTAFHTDAAHVRIISGASATKLLVEATPGVFNASTDLAVAFIGTNALTAGDILF